MNLVLWIAYSFLDIKKMIWWQFIYSMSCSSLIVLCVVIIFRNHHGRGKGIPRMPTREQNPDHFNIRCQMQKRCAHRLAEQRCYRYPHDWNIYRWLVQYQIGHPIQSNQAGKSRRRHACYCLWWRIPKILGDVQEKCHWGWFYISVWKNRLISLRSVISIPFE